MSKKLPSKCPECSGVLGESHEGLMCMDVKGCGLVFKKEGPDVPADKVGWYTENGKRYKPFKQYHTSDLDYDADEESYRFSANFLSEQKGLFPYDYDNNEVKDRLEKAGVFTAKDKADSEAGEVWVRFDDYDDAKEFLDRLNAYLRNRHTAMQALKKQMRELP